MNESMLRWEVNYFRMIAFPEDSLVGREKEQWQNIFEEDPEISKSTRAEGSAAGQYKNCQFEIEIDPLRFKLTQTAIIDFQDIKSAFPSIGEFCEARDTFDEIAKKWLSTCPRIKRLAFVAHIGALTDSREESYKLLAQILKYPKVENSREFNLQLNRRRDSSVIDNEINRLVKWRAALISVKGEYKATSGESKDIEIVEDQNLIAMELDINTVPLQEGMILESEKLIPLYEELTTFAEEIVRNGDIE